MAKIYVASSWRNKYYPEVVARLRAAGHEVYDFRNPGSVIPGSVIPGSVIPGSVIPGLTGDLSPSANGFHWTDIDQNAPNWNFNEYKEGLGHPLAERQFTADLEALAWADTCVLVLPCGRSAHTEAGWMAGAGKKVIVYIPEMQEPELMYKLFDDVVGDLDDLLKKI